MLKSQEDKRTYSDTIDRLTGLYTRLEFQERLAQELERRKRYPNEKHDVFTILSFRLYDVEMYHHLFGYQIRDLILEEFADLLKKLTRKIDFAGRLDEFEFSALLVHTDREGGLIFANRVLDDLRFQALFHNKIEEFLNRDITVPAESRLKCSIGIYESKNDENASPQELLTRTVSATEVSQKIEESHITVWDRMGMME